MERAPIRYLAERHEDGKRWRLSVVTGSTLHATLKDAQDWARKMAAERGCEADVVRYED